MYCGIDLNVAVTTLTLRRGRAKVLLQNGRNEGRIEDTEKQ